MAHTHCMGTDRESDQDQDRDDGFIYYAFKCIHYTGTGNEALTGTRANGLHTHFPVPGPSPGPVQCI